MNRTKLFIQNFLIYGLGSIVSKIIPLIMLPIITSIMTETKYYGINDIINLIINFAGAIAMMGMYDAMFRMFFDKDDEKYKKSVCSTALFFVVISSVIICILMVIFKTFIINMIGDGIQYNILLFIIVFNTFLTGIQNILSAPTRMQNKRKIFLITNTLAPIISYSISIPLLLKGMYLYALPLAALSSTFIMTITFYVLNKSWFSIREISFKHLRMLMKIGVPLMPTFIMYWICSSFDRIMIKNMLGLSELGIYSVSSRVAQISQFIYTAFTMGWQYFAFSTMNDKDQKKLISNVASYLLAISIISTMLITTFSKIIFNILAKGDYSNGFILLPYLFISPLLLMIFQIIGNQFVIAKKTYPVPLILMIGAIVNIVCNYLFITKFGIEGSAVATMISYMIAVIVVYCTTVKFGLIEKEKRINILIFILCIYLILWRIIAINNILLSIFITSIILTIIYSCFYREIKIGVSKLKNKK